MASKELRDAWGNPLVYFHRGDYGRYAERGVVYLTVLDERVEARPCRDADGSFVNPRTFQIYSMGPDGVPNTDDDITAWSSS